MQWLQDKKNLPIVIGIVAIVLFGAGFMIFKQMKANSPDMTASDQGTPSVTGRRADEAPVGTTPAGPSRRRGPSPSTPTAESPSATTAGNTATASSPTSSSRPGGKTQMAAVAKPKEDWREDPFLPLGWTPPQVRKNGPVKLIVPMPGPIFHPKPKPVEVERPDLKPQPPRRVAGIIYSQRITALLQTKDGWEPVTPGMTLRDGTLVERIERDRVVLRTTDYHPRLVEVKLAAASLGLSADAGSPSTPTPAAPSRTRSGRRPYNPGGSDM